MAERSFEAILNILREAEKEEFQMLLQGKPRNEISRHAAEVAGRIQDNEYANARFKLAKLQVKKACEEIAMHNKKRLLLQNHFHNFSENSIFKPGEDEKATKMLQKQVDQLTRDPSWHDFKVNYFLENSNTFISGKTFSLKDWPLLVELPKNPSTKSTFEVVVDPKTQNSYLNHEFKIVVGCEISDNGINIEYSSERT